MKQTTVVTETKLHTATKISVVLVITTAVMALIAGILGALSYFFS